MLTNTSSKRSPWFLETTSLLQEMSPKRGGSEKCNFVSWSFKALQVAQLSALL